MANNLIYTIAFEPKGYTLSRAMAKLLASSLLRTYFSGDIVVFRNSPVPLFPIAREGLREIYIETPDWNDVEGSDLCLLDALAWRFRAQKYLNVKAYDQIIYLDADCLALRNIDHLFEREADIVVQPEAGRSITEDVFNAYLSDDEHSKLTRSGVNAGTLAVRSELYPSLMKEWETIYLNEPIRHSKFRDQTSWNRLLLDTPLKVLPFERDEIQFPLHLHPSFQSYKKAALLHFVGGTQQDKFNLAYALYFTTFVNDGKGLYLDLHEQ